MNKLVILICRLINDSICFANSHTLSYIIRKLLNDAGASLRIYFAHINNSEKSLWKHINIVFEFHEHTYHIQNTIVSGNS